MAITRQKGKLTVDLRSVVRNSVDSVKSIRRREQARKEAEFQKAIANGLPYSEQITMREKQLELEKTSSFRDDDYVFSLEKSVTDTKKLNRFNTYRTRYAETLGELGSGKINEEEYLNTLKNTLVGITDPELRLEVQGDIATAQGRVKTYKDTILSNQVKKAKYDGTELSLSDAIGRINTARAQALIDDNQDEVTAYDETLSALNSQKATVRIQDSITGFQVKSSTRGVNPVEKLDFINSEIQRADPSAAIKIGDRTYSSAQQFWNLERDNYLSGGSQIFGNFFNQLKELTNETINVDSKVFGTNTQAVLDNVSNTYNELRAKPEMVPFLDKLNTAQTSSMSSAVNTVANKIVDIGSQNRDYDNAAVQLNNLKKYGVDITQQEVVLRSRNISEVESGKVKPGNIETLETPSITSEKPSTPIAIPEKPALGSPVENGSIIDFLDSTGRPSDFASRTVLAKEKGIVNYTGSEGQNIQLLGLVKNQPLAPVTPATPTPAPVSGQPPAIGTTIPVAPSTPTATPIPVTPSTPSAYTGSSIVDYLKSQQQDSSFSSRTKLATDKGITGYTGSPKQNEELLRLLRG